MCVHMLTNRITMFTLFGIHLLPFNNVLSIFHINILLLLHFNSRTVSLVQYFLNSFNQLLFIRYSG